MYLSVQDREEANLGTNAQITPRAGAKLGSFTSFSVCKFNLHFVFVHSDAG